MQVQFSSESFYMEHTTFSYSSTRNNIAFEKELYDREKTNECECTNKTENKTSVTKNKINVNKLSFKLVVKRALRRMNVTNPEKQ